MSSPPWHPSSTKMEPRGYVPVEALLNSDEPSSKRACFDANSAMITELSTSESGSSAASPPALVQPVAGNVVGATPDKFTKSRAVGQVHRDKEREMMVTLEQEVENLKVENVLMFAMFCTQYKQQKLQRMRSLGAADGDLMSDWIRTEEQGMSLGLFRLGEDTAARLGVRYISYRMGRVLLEVILFRRNLIPPETSTLNRKRRRRAMREPTNAEQAMTICDYAFDMFNEEAHELGVVDKAWHIDRKFAALMYIVKHWSEYEATHNVPAFEDEDEEHGFPPNSPTRPEAAEFGSPGRRRGEGAKRCSRCGNLKYTGSGHGRSKCDDGVSISSLIPYIGSPRSPRSQGDSS